MQFMIRFWIRLTLIKIKLVIVYFDVLVIRENKIIYCRELNYKDKILIKGEIIC